MILELPGYCKRIGPPPCSWQLRHAHEIVQVGAQGYGKCECVYVCVDSGGRVWRSIEVRRPSPEGAGCIGVCALYMPGPRHPTTPINTYPGIY